MRHKSQDEGKCGEQQVNMHQAKMAAQSACSEAELGWWRAEELSLHNARCLLLGFEDINTKQFNRTY